MARVSVVFVYLFVFRLLCIVWRVAWMQQQTKKCMQNPTLGVPIIDTTILLLFFVCLFLEFCFFSLLSPNDRSQNGG